MRTQSTIPEHRLPAGGADSHASKQPLRLLVGVHDGAVSGINTYIEHVAAAAAVAVSDVTLLVADDRIAHELGARLAGTDVRVVSLKMPPPNRSQALMIRVSPRYAARRLAAGVAPALGSMQGGYDAVHLNHPHLASAMRPLSQRLCVAAWFHPHSLHGRVVSTWDHSGRRLPRSAALALKGALHYRNDVRGFRVADAVVAPTRLLAAELRRREIAAVHCFAPARVLPGSAGSVTPPRGDRPRLLVCCGDLAHPRKNVALALEALRILGHQGMTLDLELVGGNAEALSRQLARIPGSIEVTLSGRLPAAEVHARMRAADALLFPSRFEEWGYVAVEAALQGTPTVTLPVYPFTEMLVPPLGVRSAAATPAAYADAITAVIDEPPSRSAVAAFAEERFGLVRTGRALAAVWCGAADEGAHDRSRRQPSAGPLAPTSTGQMSR